MIDKSEAEILGFRWKEVSALTCTDGCKISVEPSIFLRNRESLGSIERDRKALRLYTVSHEDGTKEELVSELEIERRLESV